MANGNFPYHSDQFHSFSYSPAIYSSGPSYSQNQHLFYPSQTDSQQFSNQAFHPSQNDLQQFNVESEPRTGSASKAPAKKNTRERWDPDDEKVLVQLWGENLGKLESKDSRKAWEEVTRLLNERQKTKKSVDQCQRKMKHLRTLYKESRDWNRRQSGGNIRKSPHFDVLDAILGCRDIVTCNKVQQAGMGKANTGASNGGESELSSTSSPTPSASSSVSESEIMKRKERKNTKVRAKKRLVADSTSDSEEDSFRQAMKKLTADGDRMGALMESMQQSQAQQVKLMEGLLGSFNKYMEHKAKKGTE